MSWSPRRFGSATVDAFGVGGLHLAGGTQHVRSKPNFITCENRVAGSLDGLDALARHRMTNTLNGQLAADRLPTMVGYPCCTVAHAAGRLGPHAGFSGLEHIPLQLLWLLGRLGRSAAS